MCVVGVGVGGGELSTAKIKGRILTSFIPKIQASVI